MVLRGRGPENGALEFFLMLLHRLLHGLADHLVDGLAVAQTDLLLGRMNININVLRRQAQVNEAYRSSPFHQKIA